MKLNIRKAGITDLDFLQKLEREVFPDFQQCSRQSLRKGINSTFRETLIIEKPGNHHRSVGSVVLFKYKHSLRIYSIGILSAYQNKGIGSWLIDYLKKYAINHNYEVIKLEASTNNTGLINWYDSKGFRLIKTIKNYYCPEQDAVKMIFEIDRKSLCKNIVVVDHPYKWETPLINARTVSVKDYISNPVLQYNDDFRIINLCSSYKYQSYGYYISLLASARGQRIIPNITTIRDSRIIHVIQSVAFDVDETINKLLKKTKSNSISLNVYFGQTPAKGYENLAKELFKIFEAPLFKVNFIKDEKWLIKNIKVIALKNVPAEEKEIMSVFAANYFNKKRHKLPKLTHYKYDVAVLVNPDEENPPSNSLALEKFKNAASKKNVYMEFITKEHISKINEFDALFIRETTNVSHHTYEISRLAYAEGLVVIDDPWSILKCGNKIYQNELFGKHKIRTPKTIVLTRNLYNIKQLDSLHYPVILKQPDSAFSLGVIKVYNEIEAEKEITRLFTKSDMLISQEYLYTEFDWRIGILDNKPLFACKYFMTKDNWQIYDWNNGNGEITGDHETIQIEDVPPEILKVAQKAASLIGDGLYGVDLKLINGKVYVIEVNDNPNIDAGVEDSILQSTLYEAIIDSMIKRIEIAKNTEKINLNKS